MIFNKYFIKDIVIGILTVSIICMYINFLNKPEITCQTLLKDINEAKTISDEDKNYINDYMKTQGECR